MVIFRLVLTLWRMALLAHIAYAILATVLLFMGNPVPAALIWMLWGTFIVHVVIHRRVMGRWLRRIDVQRARYWQNVNREAAR